MTPLEHRREFQYQEQPYKEDKIDLIVTPASTRALTETGKFKGLRVTDTI